MEKRLLSIIEAAEWLGLSQSYLYKLVEADADPHIRFGRAIRFDIKNSRSGSKRIAKISEEVKTNE